MPKFTEGKTYKLRNGYEAKVLIQNDGSSGPFNMLVAYKRNGVWLVFWLHPNGKFIQNGPDSAMDLMPPTVTLDCWQNLYYCLSLPGSPAVYSNTWKSEDDAIKTRESFCPKGYKFLETIHIVREVEVD